MIAKSVRKPQRLQARIDMSAFAGVVFVLLVIFFMVDAPPLIQRLPSSLPRARNSVLMPHAMREDALIVAIQRDGKVFFDRSQVAPEQVGEKLRVAVNQGAEPVVYVRADRCTRYHTVATTIDGIREAGISQVGIITERPIPNF